MLKKRRNFLKTAAITVTAASTAQCSRSEKKEINSRPNIILFLSDDQRHDTLGCTGHPIIRTPNIDELANSGCLFENAFVTTPICAASRASIFTGLLERTHKYTFRTKPLSKDRINQSYPHILKSGGYKTGFVGKLGVRSEKNCLHSAFDYFKPINRDPYFKTQAEEGSIHESELAAKLAKEFISSSAIDNQQFMLSISFNSPHAAKSSKVDNPFPPPKSTSNLYKDIDAPNPKISGADFLPTLPDFMKNSLNRERFFWRWSKSEEYKSNLTNYFRMISGIDIAIGEVVDHLNSLNLSQNTVIIYSSDNGFFLGEKGFAGKWSHYDQSIRVPLIIYDPRNAESQRGIRTEELGLNVDLCPTILDLAGLKSPPGIYGKSLLPIVNGSALQVSGRKDFLCEHLMEESKNHKWEGIRSLGHSYARYTDQDPPYEFLHDLNADADQVQNLANDPDYSSILNYFRARCDHQIMAVSKEYQSKHLPSSS